jgi:hypothetical protein
MRKRSLIERSFAAGVWLLLIGAALLFLLRWQSNTRDRPKDHPQ